MNQTSSPGKSNAMTVTLPSDREIQLTRSFDAPRALVFEAFTKPEHISRWWGPRGTSLSSCEMDFRVGGSWRYVVLERDGSEAPFKGEFREIVPPERITWTFIFDVEPFNVHAAVETAVFTEQDGKTTVVVTSVYPSVEVRDAVIESGMESGAAESYDRLEELLPTMAGASN